MKKYGTRICVFLGAVFLMALFLRMPTRLMGWDESFYMSQMSSGILDRDLMLQNDLLSFPNVVGERIRSVSVLRPDGIHIHAFSIGPSVLYSMVMIPVYACGAERFGLGMRQAITVWAVFLLALGILGLDRILHEFGFKKGFRYAAIVAAVFSTPFFRYGFKYFNSSHFPAAILTIFSVLFWMRWFDQGRISQAWAAGLASGWLVITRWQASVFLVCMAPPVILKLLEKDGRGRRLAGLSVMLAAAFLVIAIQATGWKIHYGEWFCRPVDRDFVDWMSPAIGSFLLSGYHGLIPWAPGLLVGWIGLIMMGFRRQPAVNRWLIWGFAAGILVQLYVNACVWDWWGGGSYGPRRMTFLLAPAAVGWAYLLQRLHGFWRIVLVILAMGWGLFTAASFYECVDDLTLLLTGEPDAMRPERCPVPEGQAEQRWQHWKNGIEKLTNLDFRLVEQSRVRYRSQGLLILSLLVGMAWMVTVFAQKSRCMERILLVFATAFLVMVLGVMITCFPSNTPWHGHWAAVVHDQPAPVPDEPFPDGYEDAVRLMRTYHTIRKSDGRCLLVPGSTYYEGFPGLTLTELSDYALKQSRF